MYLPLIALRALLTLAPSTDAGLAAARALVDEMQRASAALHDATWTLRRREYRNGALRDPEELTVKLREPGDVYLRWSDGSREILYRAGAPTLLVRESFVTVELKVGSWLVRSASRHDPEDASPRYIVRQLARTLERAEKSADSGVRFEDRGERELEGERVHCLHGTTPQEPGEGYYAPVFDLCMSLRTKLPTYCAVWKVEDGALRLVEEYRYGDVRVDVGLAAADFDPRNPAYRF
jgi:hypothetical protein